MSASCLVKRRFSSSVSSSCASAAMRSTSAMVRMVGTGVIVIELHKLHPMATDIRPAAVAGSWYPASADRLAREVDEYIGRAQVDDRAAPIAIVAPHAGLKYSGPVAAFAYRAVQHGE